MTISIETDNTAELEAIMTVFKNLNMDNVKVLFNNKPTPSITKGDKTIDPTPLFGMWADNPRDINEIRKNNFNRNWK